MPRYIDADKFIQKYERAQKDDWNKKTAPSSWADAYDCVIADIDEEPTADVVPKSEVEKMVQDSTRLGQENETLKDNNEHLAVMLEETKIELKAIRGAANSLKMHYEKVEAENERLKKYNTDVAFKHYNDGKTELASEIFAEIEENLNNLIRYYKEKREYVTEIEYSELEQRYCDIKIRTFEERLLKIAELKKKYTE